MISRQREHGPVSTDANIAPSCPVPARQVGDGHSARMRECAADIEAAILGQQRSHVSIGAAGTKRGVCTGDAVVFGDVRIAGDAGIAAADDKFVVVYFQRRDGPDEVPTDDGPACAVPARQAAGGQPASMRE